MPRRRKRVPRIVPGKGSAGAHRTAERRPAAPVPAHPPFPPLLFPWSGQPDDRLGAALERAALRLARCGVFAAGAVS